MEELLECRICGFKGKSLITHIIHVHKPMTVQEYKVQFKDEFGKCRLRVS